MIDRRMYKKIIGSCIVMSFMVFALLFYVKDTEATDNEIVYAPNYIYTASKYIVNGEKIAPSAPSEISGYLFAGWYTLPEGSTTYTPVAEPKENETYYAKFVPQEILGMKAQVTAALIKDEATSKTANSAIRFITTVDSNLYKEVGFNITRPGKSTPYDTGNGVVYKELYAVDATRENKGEPDTTYTPDMFHKQSEYFKTWTIGKIPETYYDSDITVRPYWITLDGTRVDGEIAVKTVNYGRAWYYVDAVAEPTNTAAPEGTASNPYETLADAVAVKTTLNPKLILKSDVTVDATVNIARTMTIESFDEAKTITYSDTTKNMMEVAENGNLTLNKLNLNGGYRAVNNVAGTVTATNVIIEGATHCGLYIDNGGYASLSNVEIKGGQRGIQLYDGGDLEGNVVKIYSPTLYGIACGNDGNDGDSINTGSSFDIEDLTVNGSTSHAVNVYGKSEVKITKGEITNSKGHGVNVQASTATLNDVDIIFDENTTGDIQGLYAYKEATLGASTVYLNNVTIKNAPTNGIQIYQGSNVIGKTVTITSPGTYGIKCGDSGSGFNLEDLTVSESGSIGLNVYSSSSATVKNGTIEKPGGHGVNLDKGSTLTLDGAVIEFAKEKTGDCDGVYLTSLSTLYLQGEVFVTEAPRHGVWVNGAGSSATIKDILNINSVGQRGLYNSSGTINGSDSTVNITDSGNYGVSTNGTAGSTTIGTLNVTRAGGNCAVTANGAGTIITIHGGKIIDSAKVGINAAGGTTVNLTNYTIQNSGTFDLQAEASNATINLTNVGYDKSKVNNKGTINE